MAAGNSEFDPPFNLTERDRQVLDLKDEDFTLLTWKELRDIIRKDERHPLSRERLPKVVQEPTTWQSSLGSPPIHIGTSHGQRTSTQHMATSPITCVGNGYAGHLSHRAHLVQDQCLLARAPYHSQTRMTSRSSGMIGPTAWSQILRI